MFSPLVITFRHQQLIVKRTRIQMINLDEPFSEYIVHLYFKRKNEIYKKKFDYFSRKSLEAYFSLLGTFL